MSTTRSPTSMVAAVRPSLRSTAVTRATSSASTNGLTT